MRDSLPHAKSARTPDAREKVKRVIAQRGLAGLANDTKWDEFIDVIRKHEAWRPSYRFKCVDGPVMGWDVEWFYHLPFPFISVEWMDVAFLEERRDHRLTSPKVTDHSDWIEEAIRKAGLDYRKGKSMMRIFGYAPRSTELFDE